MAQRAAKMKEMDPEELMRRKFRAKCLFRALGRMVMANTYWLIEGIDEYEGVEDVKRRVEQAVRGKAKKQLLSINDKALLNKPASERTDREKKYIYRIIGGLKCFKRYPNHVKKKLAAVTYFKYYGPFRVIVREHQEAHALYFIVSGEVTVSHMVYDELLEEFVSEEIGTMTAGEMFGEVSLLHNVPRTATVTTNEHCEFLQLFAEDFKNILLSSIQKQWDEVRLAMASFTYFDALDEVARREGCIVAKMKKFEENETILGDGCGVPNHVYFILSGRVQMIETLQIIAVTRLGKKYYTLHDPYVTPEESEEDFEKKWFAAYMNKKSEDKNSSGTLPTKNSVSTQTTSKAHQRTQSILKHGTYKESELKYSNTEIKHLQPEGMADTKTSKLEAKSSEFEAKEETKSSKTEVEMVDRAVGLQTPMQPDTNKRASFANADASGVNHSSQTSRHHRRSLSTTSPQISSAAFASSMLLAPNAEGRPSVRYSLAPSRMEQAKRGNLKTYFMQVCIMNPGSTFGFGENMRDRRIVALTPVHCMLMPKIWLLQRNTANIWTRIQYYLEKKIPKKQQLFEEFCKQRDWEAYKETCVEDVLARSKTVNYTSLHDVPYSIRLEEMFGI